ncbi:restriction endonuclease [Streptomyces sp. NPDC096339]|uniref:restriction endonuclease n=1 Tax=Streptomyces sp. NPDC096339 TaxID=3366086 RepID=UPI003812FC0F
MQTAWMVRAGEGGKRAELMLEQGIVAFNASWVGDLGSCRSPSAMEAELRARPEEIRAEVGESHVGRARGWARQLWTFIDGMQVGDMVVMSHARGTSYSIGQVRGRYEHRLDIDPEATHTRKVEWLRCRVSREAVSAVSQDLREALKRRPTVFEISGFGPELRRLAGF